MKKPEYVHAGHSRPPWLKKRMPNAASLRAMAELLREKRLHTVCENALCPNMGECFERGTATFLIMGEVCTRDCAFCGVGSGFPVALDPEEPERVADAVACLRLRHVVVTSVTRDDLADGGAGQYAATMRAVRERVPGVVLEVLVPDFRGRLQCVDTVLAETPEVFNHNIETVPRLYAAVRPRAEYIRSLAVLERAAGRGGGVVKSGLMVGLGETEREVAEVFRDLSGVGVQVVTVGQYLRPSGRHLAVVEYVRPELFERYREQGEALGMQIHSGPFVRSSFQAAESYASALERKKLSGLSSQPLYSGPDAELQ